MPLNRATRRRLLTLALALALALLASWWIGRLLQPERLTPILLARAEKTLGLELSLSEPADYALWPGLRLRLSGLTARVPGRARPLLTAERIDLALPWTTLTGGEPVVTQLELTAPMLDLDTARIWLAGRASGSEAAEPPHLTNGLRIDRGRLLSDAWTVDDLNLRLPELIPDTRLSLNADGVLRVAGADPLPWRLRLDGLPRHGPMLNGLELHFASTLSGRLQTWPADWPAMPMPLSDSDSPLPFELDWRGDDPMTGTLTLSITRDQAHFRGHLVPSRLLAWLSAESAPLLPPLTGVLTAPELEIEGVVLERVRIELDEGRPDARNETESEPEAPPPS